MIDTTNYHKLRRRVRHPELRYGQAQGRVTLRRYVTPGDRRSTPQWFRLAARGHVHVWRADGAVQSVHTAEADDAPVGIFVKSLVTVLLLAVPMYVLYLCGLHLVSFLQLVHQPPPLGGGGFGGDLAPSHEVGTFTTSGVALSLPPAFRDGNMQILRSNVQQDRWAWVGLLDGGSSLNVTWLAGEVCGVESRYVRAGRYLPPYETAGSECPKGARVSEVVASTSHNGHPVRCALGKQGWVCSTAPSRD